MKVYVVTAGDDSDYHIEAVFRTREGADAFVAALPEGKREDHQVEAYEADAAVGWEWGLTWRAYVMLEDGTSSYGRWFEAMRHPSACRVDVGQGCVTVFSPISAEHALEVAVEARQRWLRERAAAGA